MDVVGIVGNPSTPSRTRALLEKAVELLKERGCNVLPTIDLATSETSEELIQQATRADVLVLASPTFKAGMTGLLKGYLDWFPEKALAGKVALPLMVGAAPNHSLALEHSMKPVLSELGAIVLPGLYVIDSNIDKATGQVSDQVVQQLAAQADIAYKVASALR